MSSKLRLPSRTVHSALSKACKSNPASISAPVSLLIPAVATPRSAFSSANTLMPLRSHLQTATMSTMPATHGHNEACCNIPPVVLSNYKPKGTYKQLGDIKTYVTGPADATHGIISVYDIFGYRDQTLQGADILAAKYKVFIPDWFKGNPCPTEWFPPDTEEKQKLLGEFFGRNMPNTVAEALPAYVKAVQVVHPAITSWAIVGYCWGGKVAELVTAGAENPFSVAAVAHPAMIDPAAASSITVPYVLLASKEKPKETIAEFKDKLTVPHHIETFSDQVHGWMAARADLADPRVKAEYARGYQTVLRFLSQQWN